jgi:site-specific recombinase XerD
VTGRLHIHRHTFCSGLAKAGRDGEAIQELAGHLSLLTKPRYMHLSPAAKDSAIALLNYKGRRDEKGESSTPN